MLRPMRACMCRPTGATIEDVLMLSMTRLRNREVEIGFA